MGMRINFSGLSTALYTPYLKEHLFFLDRTLVLSSKRTLVREKSVKAFHSDDD